MKKALTILLILAAVLVALLLFLTPEKKIENEKAEVVVSTFALYDIARHLLDGEVAVQMLIPFGNDVHTFEPTPTDMVRVEKSRLFLYSGAGLEPWSANFAQHANAVDMSRFVHLRVGGHQHHHETAHEDEEHAEQEGEHSGHDYDPHYWLDVDNMALLVAAMEALFQKHFPSLDAAALHARGDAYVKRLHTLDALYKKRLQDCRFDDIVVSHNAFGYLAARYGFHVEAVSGLSPDTMPDAKTVARLSELVKAEGITTVFYESFVSDKLAAAVAREAGVKVGVLQPLANITAKEIGADYFRLMNANLLKLHDAMECR